MPAIISITEMNENFLSVWECEIQNVKDKMTTKYSEFSHDGMHFNNFVDGSTFEIIHIADSNKNTSGVL